MDIFGTCLSQLIRKTFLAHSQFPQLTSFERALRHFGAEEVFGITTLEGAERPLRDTVWHVLAQEAGTLNKGDTSRWYGIVQAVTSTIVKLGCESGISIEESLFVRNAKGESAFGSMLQSGNKALVDWVLERWVWDAIRYGEALRLKRYADAFPGLKDFNDAAGAPLSRQIAALCEAPPVNASAVLEQHFRKDSSPPSQETLQQWLAEMPNFLKARDADGDTALHRACQLGWSEVSFTLLELGADPFCMNFSGKSGLLLGLRTFPETVAQEFLFRVVWHILYSEVRIIALDNVGTGIVTKADQEQEKWILLHVLKMQDSWLGFSNEKAAVSSEERTVLKSKEKEVFDALLAKWQKVIVQVVEKMGELALDGLVLSRYQSMGRLVRTDLELQFYNCCLEKYRGKPLEQIYSDLRDRLSSLEQKLTNMWTPWINLWCENVRKGMDAVFDLPEDFPLEPFWLEIFAASGVHFDNNTVLCEKLLTHARRQEQKDTIKLLEFLSEGKELDIDWAGNSPLHSAILLRSSKQTLALLNTSHENLRQRNPNNQTAFELLRAWKDEEFLVQTLGSLFQSSQPTGTKPLSAACVRALLQDLQYLPVEWLEAEPEAVSFVFWMGWAHKTTCQGISIWHYAVLNQQWALLKQQPPHEVWEGITKPDGKGFRPVMLLPAFGETAIAFAQEVLSGVRKFREKKREALYAELLEKKLWDSYLYYQRTDLCDSEVLRNILAMGLDRRWSSDLYGSQSRKLSDFLIYSLGEVLCLMRSQSTENLGNALENVWILMQDLSFFQDKIIERQWASCKSIAPEFFELLANLIELRSTLFEERNSLGKREFYLRRNTGEYFFDGVKRLADVAKRMPMFQSFAARLESPSSLLRNMKGDSLLHVVMRDAGSDTVPAFWQCIAWGFDPWETRDALGMSVIDVLFSEPGKNYAAEILPQLFSRQLVELGLTRWTLLYPPTKNQSSEEVALSRLMASKGSDPQRLLFLESIAMIPLQAWSRVDVRNIFAEESPVAEILYRYWLQAFLEEVAAGRLNQAERLLDIITFPEVHPRWRSLDASGALWDAKTLAQVCDWVQQYGLITVCFSGVGVWTQRALQLLGNAPKLKYLDLSHGGLTSSQLQYLLKVIAQRKGPSKKEKGGTWEVLDLRYNQLTEQVLPDLQAYAKRLMGEGGASLASRLRLEGNPGLGHKFSEDFQGDVSLPQTSQTAAVTLKKLWQLLQEVPDKNVLCLQSKERSSNGKQEKDLPSFLLEQMEQRFKKIGLIRRHLSACMREMVSGRGEVAVQEGLQVLCAKFEDWFQDIETGSALSIDPWFGRIGRYALQIRCVGLRQISLAIDRGTDSALPQTVSEASDASSEKEDSAIVSVSTQHKPLTALEAIQNPYQAMCYLDLHRVFFLPIFRLLPPTQWEDCLVAWRTTNVVALIKQAIRVRKAYEQRAHPEEKKIANVLSIAMSKPLARMLLFLRQCEKISKDKKSTWLSRLEESVSQLTNFYASWMQNFNDETYAQTSSVYYGASCVYDAMGHLLVEVETQVSKEKALVRPTLDAKLKSSLEQGKAVHSVFAAVWDPTESSAWGVVIQHIFGPETDWDWESRKIVAKSILSLSVTDKAHRALFLASRDREWIYQLAHWKPLVGQIREFTVQNQNAPFSIVSSLKNCMTKQELEWVLVNHKLWRVIKSSNALGKSTGLFEEVWLNQTLASLIFSLPETCWLPALQAICAVGEKYLYGKYNTNLFGIGKFFGVERSKLGMDHAVEIAFFIEQRLESTINVSFNRALLLEWLNDLLSQCKNFSELLQFFSAIQKIEPDFPGEELLNIHQQLLRYVDSVNALITLFCVVPELFIAFWQILQRDISQLRAEGYMLLACFFQEPRKDFETFEAFLRSVFPNAVRASKEYRAKQGLLDCCSDFEASKVNLHGKRFQEVKRYLLIENTCVEFSFSGYNPAWVLKKYLGFSAENRLSYDPRLHWLLSTKVSSVCFLRKALEKSTVPLGFEHFLAMFMGSTDWDATKILNFLSEHNEWVHTVEDAKEFLNILASHTLHLSGKLEDKANQLYFEFIYRRLWQIFSPVQFEQYLMTGLPEQKVTYVLSCFMREIDRIIGRQRTLSDLEKPLLSALILGWTALLNRDPSLKENSGHGFSKKFFRIGSFKTLLMYMYGMERITQEAEWISEIHRLVNVELPRRKLAGYFALLALFGAYAAKENSFSDSEKAERIQIIAYFFNAMVILCPEVDAWQVFPEIVRFVPNALLFPTTSAAVELYHSFLVGDKISNIANFLAIRWTLQNREESGRWWGLGFDFAPCSMELYQEKLVKCMQVLEVFFLFQFKRKTVLPVQRTSECHSSHKASPDGMSFERCLGLLIGEEAKPFQEGLGFLIAQATHITHVKELETFLKLIEACYRRMEKDTSYWQSVYLVEAYNAALVRARSVLKTASDLGEILKYFPGEWRENVLQDSAIRVLVRSQNDFKNFGAAFLRETKNLQNGFLDGQTTSKAQFAEWKNHWEKYQTLLRPKLWLLRLWLSICVWIGKLFGLSRGIKEETSFTESSVVTSGVVSVEGISETGVAMRAPSSQKALSSAGSIGWKPQHSCAAATPSMNCSSSFYRDVTQSSDGAANSHIPAVQCVS